MKRKISLSLLLLSFLLLLDCERVKKQEKIAQPGKFAYGLTGSLPSDPALDPYNLTQKKPVEERLLLERLLYFIRRKEKSLDQMSEAIGVEPDSVKTILEPLLRAELVAERNGKYIANFLILSKEENAKIKQFTKKPVEEWLKITTEELPRIKEKFQQCGFEARGFNWERMARIILGGLLCDTGVGDRGARRHNIVSLKEAPLRPGGVRYWYVAIEGRSVREGAPWWSFHHNFTYLNDKMGFALFGATSRDTKPKDHTLYKVRADEITKRILYALAAEGPKTLKELYLLEGSQKEKVNQWIDRLMEDQVIKQEGGKYVINIPIFLDEDRELLVKEVDRVADRIIDKVCKPKLEEIKSLFEELMESRREMEEYYSYFLRRIIGIMYMDTCNRLINEGLMPEPAMTPPFDYWGWIGEWKPY